MRLLNMPITPARLKHARAIPPWPDRRFLVSLVVGAAVLLIASGCQGPPRYTDYDAFVQEKKPLVTSTEYRLAPPDVITITSKRVREINGHTETIRPDGKITLPLLGTTFVAGRTVEEVSAELELLARDYYEDADVSLRVASFRSKKLHVWGEVQRAGPYSYTGTNTVLEMLSKAQPTRLADPEKIHVLRPSGDGEARKAMTINLNRMVREGDTSLDAVLEEGDIIYVPPNGLASVGLAFQQLLLPLQPISQTAQQPRIIHDNTTKSSAFADE